MMCDFKPGDEVVCVDAAPPVCGWPDGPRPILGQVYVVLGYDHGPDPVGNFGLLIQGLAHDVCPIEGVIGWRHTRFRKVQSRDLSAWLKTSVGNTDKLDKRQTKKVRA